MSEFDDLVRSAWQTAQPLSDPPALAARVRRHRRQRLLWRGVEIALTLAAIAILARPLLGAAATPAYWLVMPFYVVYLPAVWWLVVRNARPSPADATRDVRTYAHIRLSQLRASLREMRLARLATVALLGYAGLAATGAFVWGGAAWREAATTLLAAACACALATWWLSRGLGRRRLREYRAMRRLAGRAA
ncbi:hypothetical protein [Luteimonas deserti]|uniref:Uncharacterized protein n=1 Tax=Luteimonas deserti TaxID=2752306 RepID=A0A7Z0QRE6_9GAMM|nr:hypothetical protein [Luteimonas deserti]NYZ62462.1 hypothetical protein [Luteimonas deserti]